MILIQNHVRKLYENHLDLIHDLVQDHLERSLRYWYKIVSFRFGTKLCSRLDLVQDHVPRLFYQDLNDRIPICERSCTKLFSCLCSRFIAEYFRYFMFVGFWVFFIFKFVLYNVDIFIFCFTF